MKLYKYIFIGIAVSFMACSDFLDVNNDPTRIGEDDVTMKVLMPTVCESTSAAYYSAGNQAMNVTHHLDNVQAGYYQDIFMAGAWTEIYLKSLNNLNKIVELAEEQNSPHYQGVALVLQALNIGLLTDTWENAPYSEGLKGSENISPAFDEQEELYMELISLLDESFPLLDEEESDFSPGDDDLFYQGDLGKWSRLAHSLKARYQLHVMDKGMATADDILSEVSKGFQSNSDDFQLVYNQQFANPWYSAISKPITESIFVKAYGKHFVDMMNGESYGINDPRLPEIASFTEGDTTWVGLESWTADDTYTALPTIDDYYTMIESPNVIMSYAELKFIEAEVAFNSGSGDAETAYTDGITAHMNKLGVSQEDMMDYLDEVSNQDFDLEHIMKEKYIATVFNYEAWNDMRRYSFSSDVYPTFVEPDINGRSEPAYRALYPDSERTRNQANFDDNQKPMTEPMWKDQ